MELFLGGSFDPIHLGHIDLIEKLLKAVNPVKILVVPCAQNPLKQKTSAPPQGRLAMAKAAIAELKDPRVEVSEVEAYDSEPSKTLQTLQKLNRPSISVVLGAEAFQRIPEWYSPGTLLKYGDFFIIPREQKTEFDPVPVFTALQIPFQSTQKNKWEYANGRTLTFLPIKTAPYSSTEIRRHIATHGLEGELPQGVQRSVWQIIKENRYYTVSI